MERTTCRTNWLLAALLATVTSPAVAQDESPESVPRPPAGVTVVDHPNDAGTSLDVEWELSPSDVADADPRTVVQYLIERREIVAEGDTSEEAVAAGEFKQVGEVTYQNNRYTDESIEAGKTYVYRVLAFGPNGRSEGVESEPASSIVQWWDDSRTWFGIILLLVSGAVVFFIQAARGGRQLKVRRIAGLDAVTEAVGRATEMGRPCLFVPGIQDINNIQTVAGITVLSRVARIAAEYDAKIEVPTARSLVMTTARETVEASYLAAGRPDAYNEDDIYYVTDEQFGYVASVTGTMVREEPAACFYMGAFYAESLILAETGNSVGAIQVAGTAMPAQLPFFVAACDYTLLGEEFFAASAYLSGEPQQLGSLKGQDVGKVLGVILLLLGCLLATVQAVTQEAVDGDSIVSTALAFVKDHVLGDHGFMP